MACKVLPHLVPALLPASPLSTPHLALGTVWVEVKNADKHSTIYKVAPTIRNCPQMSIEPRLKPLSKFISFPLDKDWFIIPAAHGELTLAPMTGPGVSTYPKLI